MIAKAGKSPFSNYKSALSILEVRLQKFAYRRGCHGADLSCYFQAILK